MSGARWSDFDERGPAADETPVPADEPFTDADSRWMGRALDLARLGGEAGEVPVGAVVVGADGRCLGEAWNAPVGLNDPSGHAEILALRAAGKAAGNYRLGGATLYVTLEPCPMCAGALVHARVARVVFGARDLRFGGTRSKFRIADSELLNHRVEVREGLRGAECVDLLREFFGRRRGEAETSPGLSE